MTEQEQQIDLTKGKEKDSDITYSECGLEAKCVLGLPRKDELVVLVTNTSAGKGWANPSVVYMPSASTEWRKFEHVLVKKRKFLEVFTEEDTFGSDDFVLVMKDTIGNTLDFTKDSIIRCVQCELLFEARDQTLRRDITEHDNRSTSSAMNSICQDCFKGVVRSGKKARAEEISDQGSAPKDSENVSKD